MESWGVGDVRARPETTSPVPDNGQNLLSYYRGYAWKCQIAAQKASTEKQREQLQTMVGIWRDFASQHEQMINAGDGQIDTLIRKALWLDVNTFGF
jgi:hypothetical protein